MRVNKLHEWSLSIEDAKSIQKNLHAWITLEDQFTSIKNIARIKVKSLPDEPIVKASVSLLSYPDLKILEKQSASVQACFPSVNGLMSFRHMPAIIEALTLLKKSPDLLLCDGRGIIDKHSFGLASHLGLLTHKPTMGVCKAGKDMPLAQSIENIRGAWLPIPAGNVIVAGLIRVNEDTDPIQVSPGYGISINSTMKYVLDCFPRETKKTSPQAAVDIGRAKKKISA